MSTIPPIRKLMTPFPYAVDLDEDTAAAKALMAEHDFHHLPVTSEDRLVGVITAHDIAQFEHALGKRGEHGPAPVRDVYRSDAYIVDMEAPLDCVLAEMAKRHIGSVVITRKGRLAGVFTTTDLCRYVAEDLRYRLRPDGGNDAA